MSSSGPSVQNATERTGSLAGARPAFAWIELLVVPIAASVMETQALVLGMLTLSAVFLFQGVLPIDELSITLLILGLHWWALFVRQWALRGMIIGRVRLLHTLGLLLAPTLLLITHPDLLQNVFALFITLLLVVWYWRRGMQWARAGLSDELLVPTFRIRFYVVVIVLFVSVIASDPRFDVVLAILPRALPLFFFSGVLALSFTRLGLIRRDTAHQVSGIDPTRSWLLALTLLWITVTLLALGLETFTFQALQDFFVAFWNFLGFILYWIFYGIAWLLFKLAEFLNSLLPHSNIASLLRELKRNPLLGKPEKIRGSGSLLESYLIIARWVLLGGVVLLLIFLSGRIVRSWRLVPKTDEEEIRENLSISEILRARRQEREQRQQDEPVALEALPPDSARARYRDLLQTMEAQGGNLGRNPGETPSEYRRRLAELVQQPSAVSVANSSETEPSDLAILDELTQAYEQERYGGKQTDQREKGYLQSWVPRLLRRLSTR